MSMLQSFYGLLTDMFTPGELLDPADVKEKLDEGGFEDVTAHDVREAVNLMYEEGDVFSPEQSRSLEAYTGGNQVDQSFNGSNIGVATTTGTASSGSTTNTAAPASSSGGGAPAAPAPTPPPPPPMEPKNGQSELDAAVEQIVYVSNVTNNNTYNTTNIDDRDVFEDNDTINDQSINQNILAHGDVDQDFDSAVAGDAGVANTGKIKDSNVVTGDENVVADEIEGAVVQGDGNTTNTQVDSDGSAIGDGNATGENSTAGDGNTQFNVEGGLDGVVNLGGEVNAIQDSETGATGFGKGDVTNTADSHNTEDSHNTSDSHNDNSDNSDNSDHSSYVEDNSDNSDYVDVYQDISDSTLTDSTVSIPDTSADAAPADMVPDGA